jgi:hypothetical protein
MSNLRRLSLKRVALTVALSSLLVGGGSGLASATDVTAANKKPPPVCPKNAVLKQRSAEETIRQHLAALKAGNFDLAICDFADDAVVIVAPLDGPEDGIPPQVTTGLDNIKMGLEGVIGLLGGPDVPVVNTLTATDSVVQITFTGVGAPCSIPDGSDTYIVEKGKITTQTVHDTFVSSPGQTCPVAAPLPPPPAM